MCKNKKYCKGPPFGVLAKYVPKNRTSVLSGEKMKTDMFTRHQN